MSERLVIKKNEHLTKAAKNVFGEDIVKQAYICFTDFYECEFFDIDEKISENELYNSEVRDYLSTSSEYICIEFVNGKKIVFNSSEWYKIYNIETEKEWAEIE